MEDTKLREVVESAQNGDNNSLNKVLEIFEPLIYKNSLVNGIFNDDYFQELCIRLINCIRAFRFNTINNIEEYFEI